MRTNIRTQLGYNYMILFNMSSNENVKRFILEMNVFTISFSVIDANSSLDFSASLTSSTEYFVVGTLPIIFDATTL